MKPSTNGNGNGKAAAVGVIPAGVVLVICGAFSSAYVRDQNRLEARTTALETARIDLAESLGRIEQRLDQIESLALTNRDNIQARYSELDTALQREMRLINDTTRVDLVNLDERLQAEITRSAMQDQDQADGLRQRLEEIEKWKTAFALLVWTEDDQRQFAAQMGLKLRTPEQP